MSSLLTLLTDENACSCSAVHMYTCTRIGLNFPSINFSMGGGGGGGRGMHKGHVAPSLSPCKTMGTLFYSIHDYFPCEDFFSLSARSAHDNFLFFFPCQLAQVESEDHLFCLSIQNSPNIINQSYCYMCSATAKLWLYMHLKMLKLLHSTRIAKFCYSRTQTITLVHAVPVD